jgi:phage gp36-like protein
MTTPQTYCTRADLESTWNPAAVLAAADDDSNGSLSTAEEAHITRAIERAASTMNGVLEVRYDLGDLVDNAWCRDCNAALAAYLLATRSGDAAPDTIAREFDRYLDDLAQIRDGLQNVPHVTESEQHGPTVSNFRIDLREPRAKVRRVPETCTGSYPPSEVRSFPETD